MCICNFNMEASDRRLKPDIQVVASQERHVGGRHDMKSITRAGFAGLILVLGLSVPPASAAPVIPSAAAKQTATDDALVTDVHWRGRHYGWHHHYGWRHHHGWRHHYGWRHHHGWRHHYGWYHHHGWRHHYGWRHHHGWRHHYGWYHHHGWHHHYGWRHHGWHHRHW
jgi:hypothetical protein